MQPPPLPARVACRIFYGKSGGGIRLVGPKYLREIVENAHAQAREWINSQPDIEILSIDSGNGPPSDASLIFFVTVWYRDGGRPQPQPDTPTP